MFGINRLIEISDRDNFAARMDPRTKIIFLVLVATVVVILDNPRSLLALFLLAMLVYFSSRLSLQKFVVLFLFLSLGIWGIMLSQALFYSQMPRTVILTVIKPEFPVIGRLTNGVYLYEEGFRHGAIQSLRYAITLTFGLFTAWTTEPHKLLTAMVKLKTPYKLAFMTTTGIRFLPLIIRESTTVITAQRLRKYSLLSFLRIIKTAFHTLSPVLSNCIRRSNLLSTSIESRAFSMNLESRSSIRKLTFGKSDYVVLGIAGMMLLTILIFKAAYWLYITGICYSSGFRGIYEIAQLL